MRLRRSFFFFCYTFFCWLKYITQYYKREGGDRYIFINKFLLFLGFVCVHVCMCIGAPLSRWLVRSLPIHADMSTNQKTVRGKEPMASSPVSPPLLLLSSRRVAAAVALLCSSRHRVVVLLVAGRRQWRRLLETCPRSWVCLVCIDPVVVVAVTAVQTVWPAAPHRAHLSLSLPPSIHV